MVTFTEDRAVVQAQSGSNPSATPALFTAGVVTLTQTVTDNDGTVASASLDLGAKLSITDDGPIVTVTAANEPSLTLSETHLTTATNPDNGTSPNLPLTSTTGNFVVAFNDTPGADGTRTIAYALSITGGSGTASGLVDSHTQQSDVLVQVNATTIEGHVGSAGGALAFTISVASNGVVTFTEDRAVVQAQSGSNPSATPALFTAGVVTLTQTVTDNDGTVASASLDLGAKLSITDDGPIVTVTAANEPSLTLSETHLTTATNPDNGTSPNLPLTSTTGNFVVAFNDTPGADGTRTTTYALSITGGSGVASGLTDSHTQLSDVLVQVNPTTIEGRVGTTTGALAFTISFDPATGLVTFTEDRAVVQAQSGSNPSATPALFTAGVVTLTQTVTDNDGTVASASLDLGAKLSITDDGPIVTVTAANEPSLTLSETHLTTATNPDSGTAPNAALTSTTGNFTAAFNDTPGADGTRTIAYALSITGGSGTASGLVDSHTQQSDVLVQVNATTIEGHVGSAGGALAFTISVASNGVVTFTEDRAVVQAQSGSNPSATPALFTAGVVTLTQTVTDNDGTVASASLDLGAKLSITDDGPIVTVTAANEPSLTLSETHLTTATNPDNGTSPNLPLTSTTGNFVVAFNDTPGADGTRTTTYALSITGGSGVASGLTDSHTQLSDVLVQVNATTIEGHVGSAGGALAFTISVASNGVVTFTEDRAVVQAQSGSNPSATPALFTAGVVTLTQTVTDNDGTVASASLDLGARLSITDDGPIVTVTAANEPSLTLSETHLTTATNPDNGTSPNAGLTSTTGNFAAAFNDTPGADGTKTIAYALSITGGSGTASGLVDSHTQQSDVLVQVNATTIEGHVGTTGGALAFTISVASNGVVTFTEARAVDNNSTGVTGVSLAAGVLTLAQTITDNDGTHASASIDLGVKLAITDDTPTAFIPGLAVLTDPSSTSSSTPLSSITVPLDVDGNVHNNFGADGGMIHFASTAVASLTALDLTSGGAPITYGLSNSDETLTAITTINGATETVFTITLNPNAPNPTSPGDTYTVNMFAPVDSVTTVDFSSGGYSFFGGNTAYAGYTSSTSPIALLATPIDLNKSLQLQSGGTINGNADEFGVNTGQSIGPGEGVRIDFVTNLTGNPTSSGDYSLPANQTASYTSHLPTDGATEHFFLTGNNSSTEVLLAAISIPIGQGPPPPAPTIAMGSEVDATAVSISFNGQTVFVPESALNNGIHENVVVGGNTFTVEFLTDPTTLGTQGGKSPHIVADVGNIESGADIGLFAASNYSALETLYRSGHDFSIGGFGASVPSAQPVDFSVPLTITDGDLSTVSGALSVSLLPGLVTQDHSADTLPVNLTSTLAQPNLIGGSGNDNLTGLNVTSDVLYGGPGNDTLNAGTTGIDILIGGPGENILTGTTNASATSHDEFVLQATTNTSTAFEHDTINNFNPSFDGILVDIGAGGTIASAMASSGIANTDLVVGASTAFNGPNHFAFNTVNQELYFSPDATAAHAIDLAHLATGVPTAGSIHTF